MATRWRPELVILPHAERLVQRVSQDIRAKQRKPHTGARGAPGGGLATKVLAIVSTGRARVVVAYSKLGQPFMWLRRGTRRQPGHQINLLPDEAAIARDVEADAVRHFSQRDQRESRG